MMEGIQAFGSIPLTSDELILTPGADAPPSGDALTSGAAGRQWIAGGLSHSIHASVTEIPPHDWNLLTAADADLTMDDRLIRAYESMMGDQCRTFTVVIRDAAGKAVALACSTLFRVDLGNYVWLRHMVATARKLRPHCGNISILFCGLPIPSGQNHLRIAHHANRPAVLAELDRAMRNIAREQGAIATVVKEFTDRECDGLQSLGDLGYSRIEIPPRYVLSRKCASFDDYLDSLKAHYRADVNRSLKKFRESGLRVEQVRGPVDLPRVYTDDVHRMYEAMRARTEYPLEIYPAQFMRDLGRRFGRDASLTCIYQARRLVAFTIGLARGPIYHNLYSGLDDSLRRDSDLYFNLFYRDLDFAWRSGAQEIHLGQTADQFKSRLGSQSERMYLFIRPTNRLVRWAFNRFSRWVLPKIELVKPYHVFKEAGKDRQKRPQRREAPGRSDECVTNET